MEQIHRANLIRNYKICVVHELPILPEDLTIEIFSWLPVKSIYKFRAANKFMYNLPHNSNFIKLHFKRSKSTQIALWSDTENELLSFYCVDKVKDGGVKMDLLMHVADKSMSMKSYDMSVPFNGLVCLFSQCNNRIFVVNPSSREFITIPVVGIKRRSMFVASKYSVFIGFDGLNNKYKLLKMVISNKVCTKSEVFDLGKRGEKWRSVECTPRLIGSLSDSRMVYVRYSIHEAESVYVNGTSNWLVKLVDDKKWGILSYDFHYEKFQVLPLPKLMGPRIEGWSCLKVFDEYVCFLELMESWTLNIWLLKDYTGLNWVKEYTIDLNDIDVPVGILRYCSVAVRGRKIMFQWDNIIYKYDLERKTVETLVLTVPYKLCDYVESLVSPFRLHQ